MGRGEQNLDYQCTLVARKALTDTITLPFLSYSYEDISTFIADLLREFADGSPPGR